MICQATRAHGRSSQTIERDNSYTFLAGVSRYFDTRPVNLKRHRDPPGGASVAFHRLDIPWAREKHTLSIPAVLQLLSA